MTIYYAVFEPEGERYNVSFPDLEGAFTFGEDMHDALHMAKDLLEGWLLVTEKDGDPLPAPSLPHDIKPDNKDSLIIPIEVDLDITRKKQMNYTVKKTLTIPQYLNELGNKANINFSQTLTEALKEKLGV